MSYAVRLHPPAQKELNRLSDIDFRRVDAAIYGLRSNPRPFGVQKLKGALHRIRVGHWRVLYAIFDDTEAVVILRIARRNEQTYKFLAR